MELKLLTAILNDRSAYESVKDHITARDFAPIHGALFQKAFEYYETDAEASSCDIDLLAQQVESSLSSDSTISQMYEMVEEIKNTTASSANVVKLVLEKKTKDKGMELAQAILTDDSNAVSALLEQYVSLQDSSIDSGEELEEYNSAKLTDLVQSRYSDESIIHIAPKSLNNKFLPGLIKGQHIVVAARPEAGKTALCVTLMCAIAYQGFKVLFYSNEEPVTDVIFRVVSQFTGWSTAKVRENPEEAEEIASQRGYDNIFFVTAQSNNTAEIRSLCAKYDIDVILVDQIRNLEMGTDSQTEQLERAAKEIRAIARKDDVLAISVTQVGESGQNKPVLTISDIDNSKTGLPGACDAMIMIGFNQQLASMGRRCITLPKNKIGTGPDSHASWNVVLNQIISRYQDE